jgi:hypothetical protein
MDEMTIVEFKKWKLACHVEATREAYAKIERGSPVACGCNTCKNFAAARQYAYPQEARSLLEQLGVDIDKEAEVYHNCRLETGLHNYGGWFHFIGSIKEGPDSTRQIAENSFTFDLEPIDNRFVIGFTARAALVARSFGDQPVIQVEFRTEVPWIIQGPEAE